MILSAPLPFRSRRRRSAITQPPVLLSGAYFSGTSPTLTLNFDRAIDIAGIAGSAFIVNDAADTGDQYVGGAATLLAPKIISIVLHPQNVAQGTGCTLNATANNGIVAQDTQGVWAGVMGFVLMTP